MTDFMMMLGTGVIASAITGAFVTALTLWRSKEKPAERRQTFAGAILRKPPPLRKPKIHDDEALWRKEMDGKSRGVE